MGNCLCAPGFPVPEVSWFRDGQAISTSTLPGVQISFSDGRAKLTIPAVTKANSGRYSLRATNGSGQATSTAELLVTGRLEGTCLSSGPSPSQGISRTWGRGDAQELPSTSTCSWSPAGAGPTWGWTNSKVVYPVEFHFLLKMQHKCGCKPVPLYRYCVKHSKVY